ncbi:hypothetical protein GCM10010343_32600 [Streptomyces avidinii]|nr:hypothetical protein GCM10010343_32600 [Streptomyces avidinii]
MRGERAGAARAVRQVMRSPRHRARRTAPGTAAVRDTAKSLPVHEETRRLARFASSAVARHRVTEVNTNPGRTRRCGWPRRTGTLRAELEKRYRDLEERVDRFQRLLRF